MSNIRTIVRRDLGAYFTSPIGYIFIIVFLAISVGLYITSFFTFPVADMRSYFGNLPLMMCVFIPAVTMRVWAEERKENTWEMLLTFPMRAWELVIGKFLATFLFFTITVACTFTVPLMLAWLGDPDNGAIFGGYLGTLLLGAFFLSIGIFFSGFCRDQIVAFVVSLLACFAIFLFGTNFIASYIDGYVPGLGSLLSKLIGMVEHFQSFTRGVIELVDVVYFVVWTALFLVLNIMFIEQRNRPGSRFAYATAVALSFGIGLLFNWLVNDMTLARFDLTEDKSYTVSPATRTILSQLESPAQIKVYISPKEDMPTAMKSLEQDITDKLAELKFAANGKLEFTPVYLKAANVLASQEDLLGDKDEKKDAEKSDAEKIEKRMLSKGIQPFMVSAMVNEELTQKPVYSSIGVGYRDAKEEIIPQVMPESLPELEYRLVNTIYKLSRKEPPRVALVAPKEAVNIPPQLRQLYMQMGQPVPESEDPYEYCQMLLEQEKYKVERVELTQHSPLPETYDTLVVINPRELNDRQKWEINRALVSGKNVVLAVQNYEWEYRLSSQGELNLNKRDQNPQINDLLKYYGLGVSTDILMDKNQVPLTIRSSSNPLEALMGGGTTVKLPMHMLINNSTMDTTAPITNRLSTIFYLWGTALDINKEELAKYNLDAKVVMSTTDNAWSVPADKKLSNADIAIPPSGKSYPLMALVTGQFPDAYKDKPRPAWPPAQPTPGMPPQPSEPETGEAPPLTPAPGKLVLIGCSEMFNKNFLQAGNLDLFLNCVDNVTLGDDIVSVRGKKPIDRAIDKPTDAQRGFWKFMNYAAVNLVVAGIGISTAVARRQSRNAYTMSFQSQQSA